jgi:calcyclin binding protein
MMREAKIFRFHSFSRCVRRDIAHNSIDKAKHERIMVLVEEIKSEEKSALMPSDERLLDAEEIDNAAKELKRPGARLQLDSLAKKLRKEAAALKRVEQSQAAATKQAPKPTPVSTPVAASAPPKKVEAAPLPAPSASSSVKYTTVDRFSFDPGQYKDKFVTIYVPLPGVGSISKDNIACQFSKNSFDLIARDLKGKSYRLFKDNIDKDIDVEKSKYIVKADKIVVKLCKIMGEYGSYDMWTQLTDPKKKDKKRATTKDNPMASITDLMKDMYESGDDKMKKMIGETMLKQRNGELSKEDTKMGDFDDFGDGI